MRDVKKRGSGWGFVGGAIAVAAGVAVCLGQAGNLPATRPAFTIGKETTIVEGPVNADGTINYLAAINKLIGEGVKNEENAAPLLLGLSRSRNPAVTETRIFDELNLSRPAADDPRVEGFAFYRGRKAREGGDPAASDELVKNDDMATAARSRPWKAIEFPEVAAWLKENEKALTVAEQACKRPRFYLPFVNHDLPPLLIAGLPHMSRIVPEVLETRAMLRAGEGDLEGGLADLKRVRIISRLMQQEHLDIFQLLGVFTEVNALRGYATLAASGTLDKEELAKLRREIDSLAPFPADDDKMKLAEEMFVLDTIMMCIRGNAQPVMRLNAFLFDQSKAVALGDLEKVDWDTVLREVVRLHADLRATVALPFEEKLKAIEKLKTELTPDKFPPVVEAQGDGIFPGEGVDSAKVQHELEKFLEMRPDESKQLYSIRMGTWMSGINPTTLRGFVLMNERGRLWREMALLAVTLAEYRLAHGTYPDALRELGGPILMDTLAGKDISYRRDGSGFVCWSVGPNEKDDGGTKDDLAIRGER